MSILYDEAQEAIGMESRRVLEARSDKTRLLGLLEETGKFDQTFWTTAVEQGWSALALPEEHGGLDLGLTELGLIAQSAGAVIAGAPFLTTNYGAGQLLMASGDARLQQEWLPRLAQGEAIGTVAFAEGNSPLPAIPSTIFADGVLNGAKQGVSGGLKADFAVVWALLDGKPALAYADLAGAERTPVESFDNSRLYADITFSSTPATVLLEGEPAHQAALQTLGRLAVVAAHEQTGGAEAAMLEARDFANTRKAFGQPIGGFQSVKHRIAELYGLIEIARANCIHAASREGEAGFLVAAAAARLSATEAYDTAARDAIQIHGGIGVTWDSGLHLHMRRARSLAIEQGNVLFWEDLLVGELTGVSA
jgi:acyl-CoA dehydrogenase